ncbi:MAG TPA: HD domain-containing protein [Nitrosopumilaceae archaeon]|nr:HD domain-containing protein [Nitrosopumilaceae archaeon]
MLFDFFNIVSELKKTPRKGWKEKLGLQNPESVADHSYMTAIIAMILSDLKGLDTKKILKMSLLHDLAESITGDLMPEEISKTDKMELENQIISDIFTKLPTKLADDYTKIWHEYHKTESKEAELVHEVDRLEMALQARKYRSEGLQEDKLETFFSSARKNIKSKEILEILDEISYK